MTFIEKFMPRAEPLLTESDLADCNQPSKPVDTRDDLAKFGDTMDKLLDQRLKRREQIASDIDDLEARIADLVEQDRQNTVIIEEVEHCARRARDEAADQSKSELEMPGGFRWDADAERSRDEHESARHEPEQERETA